VRGDVAVLTFHTGPSESGGTGFGFAAKVSAEFYNDRTPFYSANYVFTKPDPFQLTYPGYGAHSLNEFSFFVFAPNSEGNTGVVHRAFMEIYFQSYCADNVVSYLFSERSGTGGNWLFDRRYEYSNGINYFFCICILIKCHTSSFFFYRICEDGVDVDYVNYTLLSREAMLFRFYSDGSPPVGGFSISYS